ncbi:MAG: hypothetical protein AB9873_16150 [Syntrophobacteraceae bacterium]
MRNLIVKFIHDNRMSFDVRSVKSNGYPIDDDKAKKYRRYGVSIFKDSERIIVYLSLPASLRPTPDEVLSVLALDFFFAHSLNVELSADSGMPGRKSAFLSRRADKIKKDGSWRARLRRAEELRTFFGERACKQLLDIAREQVKRPHFWLAEAYGFDNPKLTRKRG